MKGLLTFLIAWVFCLKVSAFAPEPAMRCASPANPSTDHPPFVGTLGEACAREGELWKRPNGDVARLVLPARLRAETTLMLVDCAAIGDGNARPSEPFAVSAEKVGRGIAILKNRPLNKIARVLDDGTTQLVQNEYNSLRRVTKTVDPMGRTTTYTYADNEIDLLEVRQKVGETTELIAKTTYDERHLPLTVVDASGGTNSFGYNEHGQLLATTNANNEVTTMAYDASGYLTNITGTMPGATRSFTYDGYGRVRTITDSEGYTVTCNYDVADRPTTTVYPDGTYEQTIYQWLDAFLHKDRRGHWSSTRYDALRRVTDVQDSENRVTHYQWCSCGALESITDPMGRMTSWVRDITGRVTAKMFADGTQYQYGYESSTGRLRWTTDAMNQTVWNEYHADGSLKQQTYSNAVVATPSVSYTYDTNYSRLLTMTDGVGTHVYSYYPVGAGGPGAGRLQSIDGPLPDDTVTYTYDNLGRMKTRALGNATTDVTYDALGRMTVMINALGGFTNHYVNATARISAVDYPNGQRTELRYFENARDQRLEEIKHLKSGGDVISRFNYSYDADGQIETWTQQAGAATPRVWSMEYDAVDQLTGVSVREGGPTGELLKRFVYGYDPAGNRVSEQVTSGAGLPPAVSKSMHNNLNQLTEKIGGGPVRFAGRLNEAGTVRIAGTPARMSADGLAYVGQAETWEGTNVVAVVATDYNEQSRTNRYQLVVTNNGVARTLTYDLNGNLTTETTAISTNTYTWDAADRLVGISSLSTINHQLSTFTYDGLGRRVRMQETTNGATASDKRYVWVGTELAEERDATGATVTKRYFAQGEQHLSTINNQLSTINYFTTRDHLGSIREMTDASGAVRARYEYDPYGVRTKVSGDLDADFGFTGHYYHAPSGLHLALYRAYDAGTGRWLSRDPIAEKGGLNLYAYCGNDPVNSIDALGLVSEVDVSVAKSAVDKIGKDLAANIMRRDLLLNQLNRTVVKPPVRCLYSKEYLYNVSAIYDKQVLKNEIQALNSEIRSLYLQYQQSKDTFNRLAQAIAAAGAGASSTIYGVFTAETVGVSFTGYGATGAAVAGTAVVGAAVVGGAIGYGVGKISIKEQTIHEWIGSGLYNICPSCFQ